MLRYKAILTAAVLAAFMFVGFVQSGNALEILSLYPTTSSVYDTGGMGVWHAAKVEVDEGDCYVSWYVGSSGDDIEHHSTNWISEPDRSATFGDYLSGDIKGEKYFIAAFLYKYREDERLWEFTPFTWYDTRIFKSKVISGFQNTGVYGWVELERHYHDGSNIVVDGWGYAYNPSDNVTCDAASWFRHSEYREDHNGVLVATGWELQDPPFNPQIAIPRTPLPPSKGYSDSGSSYINYPVGGDIGRDQVIILNAHVHLEVHGNGKKDVWHELNHAWTHEFRYEDNESYEGD